MMASAVLLKKEPAATPTPGGPAGVPDAPAEPMAARPPTDRTWAHSGAAIHGAATAAERSNDTTLMNRMSNSCSPQSQYCVGVSIATCVEGGQARNPY
jgi:hypothetical protein